MILTLCVILAMKLRVMAKHSGCWHPKILRQYYDNKFSIFVTKLKLWLREFNLIVLYYLIFSCYVKWYSGLTQWNFIKIKMEWMNNISWSTIFMNSFFLPWIRKHGSQFVSLKRFHFQQTNDSQLSNLL